MSGDFVVPAIFELDVNDAMDALGSFQDALAPLMDKSCTDCLWGYVCDRDMEQLGDDCCIFLVDIPGER